MNSIYNINNNPTVLDNVDFVISTIPLGEIKKPYVVISPLLQKAEINKVKEAIWLAKSEIKIKGTVNEVAEEISSQYDGNDNAKEYADSRNIIPYNVTTLIGEVSMNIFDLVTKLYPKGITPSVFDNVSGIFAHILMSIPRWQRGSFIEPSDEEELIRQNEEQYLIIRRYLEQEAKRLGIFIPEAEAIAILRYYIY